MKEDDIVRVLNGVVQASIEIVDEAFDLLNLAVVESLLLESEFLCCQFALEFLVDLLLLQLQKRLLEVLV